MQLRRRDARLVRIVKGKLASLVRIVKGKLKQIPYRPPPGRRLPAPGPA